MSTYWDELHREMDSRPELYEIDLVAPGGVMVGTRQGLRDSDYQVIADVDDMVVGWTHFAPFVRFMVNGPKHKKQVSNVEYCGNEGCMRHLQLLLCFRNDVSKYTDDPKLLEAASRYSGQTLPKLPYLKISSYGAK